MLSDGLLLRLLLSDGLLLRLLLGDGLLLRLLLGDGLLLRLLLSDGLLLSLLLSDGLLLRLLLSDGLLLRLLLSDGLSALLLFCGAGVGIAQGNVGNDLFGVALGVRIVVHRRLLHFPGFGQDIGFFPYSLEIFVPGFGHHFGFLPHFRGFSAAAGFVGGFTCEGCGGNGVIGGGCGALHGSRGGCRFFAGRHDVFPGFPFAGILPAGGHFLVGLFLGGAFLFTADALDAGVAVDGFFQFFDACFEPGFFRGGVGVVLEVGNINFFAVLFGGGFGGQRGFSAVLFGLHFGVEGVETRL